MAIASCGVTGSLSTAALLLLISRFGSVHASREGDESSARENVSAQPSLAAVRDHAGVTETTSSSSSIDSSRLGAAVQGMSKEELKDEFLAFLESKAQLRNTTQALPCAEQWNQRAERLKMNQNKLFEGMQKVREANVLLAAVDATNWARLFGGSRRTDDASAAKVKEAVTIGGTLLGRLDKVGTDYDQRLQSLTSEDQRVKFMDRCESNQLVNVENQLQQGQATNAGQKKRKTKQAKRLPEGSPTGGSSPGNATIHADK